MELPGPDQLVGRTLGGQYRVLSVLATGGMGTVYVAQQLNLDRKVAVKVLRPDAQRDETLVARFRAEAQIISTLRHPNTLKLFDYGATEDGVLYLVTALLEGEPLSTVLKRGAMPQARVVHILRETLASLAEAHAMGVVHRDLKPGNIFVEQLGKQELVKVLDFGIAKVSPGVQLEGAQVDTHPTDGPPETLAGTLVGTPAYISPEQAYARPVDARSDLYSLGVVAYQALTGRLPFEGEAVAQLAAHAMDPPPAFRTLIPVPEVDERLEQLVLQLLSKRPEDRPQSAEALLEQLDALGLGLRGSVSGSVSGSASGGAPSQPPEPAPAGRSGWLAAALGIALLVGVGGLWSAQRPQLTPLTPLDGLDPTHPPNLDEPALNPALVDTASVTSTSPRLSPLPNPTTGAAGVSAKLGPGWRQPEALRPIVARLSRQLRDCYDTTGARGVVRLRIEVGPSSVALQTSPGGDEGKPLKTCMQLGMDELIRWPPHARRGAHLSLTVHPLSP